jgi:hypothetical protein
VGCNTLVYVIHLDNVKYRVVFTFYLHKPEYIQNCYIVFCSEELKGIIKISIQAAHEQVNPTDLLNDVIIMDKNLILFK